MSHSYKPAVMDGVGLFIALAGTSRSGKTKTALRLAKGIAGTKKIAAIDTEGKRLSHYSDEFDFDVINMRSPFSGQRFADLAKEAEAADYGALVLDSFSLEWSGVGGVLELYDDFFAKANFNQKASDVCWARAKKEHKRMMNELVQLSIPIIFCMRANAVPTHLCKNGSDKAPGGAWKVEQDKRFIYEWTIGLVLHPDHAGKPRFDMVDFENKPLWKVNPEHRHLFPEGKFITEAAGEELRKWRFGEQARKAGSAAVGSIAGAALDDGGEDAAERQSFAQEPPKKRTLSQLVEELEAFLVGCQTTAAVDDRIAAEDVRFLLERAPEHIRPRLNAMIKSAMDRVRSSDDDASYDTGFDAESAADFAPATGG